MFLCKNKENIIPKLSLLSFLILSSAEIPKKSVLPFFGYSAGIFIMVQGIACDLDITLTSKL